MTHKKGKLIRYSDTDLIFGTWLTLTFGVWYWTFMVLQLILPYLLNSLRSFDLLPEDGIYIFLFLLQVFKMKHYFIFSLVFSLLFDGCVVLMFCLFGKVKYKQLQQRQELAKMVVENGLYETMFLRVSFFPDIYYKYKDDQIKICVPTGENLRCDKLLDLEDELGSALSCECVKKELKESYIEYTLC